jgi:glucosamine-6-phosphate deaminase
MPKTSRYRVFENPDSACAQVASEIAQLIRERALLGRKVVLGLATGRTPLPLYEELIYQHREENLSFANVVTFNLDEYLDLPPGHPSSFRAYMRRNFFDHVDIPEENIHLLGGNLHDYQLARHCLAYEKKIRAAGGIDYQILGIGRSGHIGFNEPGTPSTSRTGKVELGEMTRNDAARDFGDDPESVPRRALTMGCGTILEARRIALLAWGTPKARIVRRAILGPRTAKVCASYLQRHPFAHYFLDQNSAALVRPAVPTPPHEKGPPSGDGRP